MSDPTAPTPVSGGVMQQPSYEHDVQVSDGIAYVVSGDWLPSVDVTDPSSPSLVDPDRLTLSGYFIRLALKSSFVYVTAVDGGGMRIVDVSDPSDMRPVGALGEFSTLYDVELHETDEIAYLAAWDDGLLVVDISNPANPSLAEPPVPTTNRAYRIAQAGRLVCVSSYDGTVDIFASSSPPVADADGPYVPRATSWSGAVVLLSGEGSYDPDYPEEPDAIVSYEWDLNLSYDSDGDGYPTNDVDAIGPTPSEHFPMGQTDIGLVLVDRDGLRSQQATTSVTVSTIPVQIDIKPGSDQNSINLGSHGVVPVAFLTAEGFDAATIDPATVTLRGEDFQGFVKLRGKKDVVPMANLEDVDGDGDLDLIVHLDTERLADHELTAVCELGALTRDGYVVSGTDTIRVVPAE